MARDEPRDQAAEGRSHLVGARRKPLSHQGDDPGIDPGELRGNLHGVDGAESAPGSTGFVLPGDPEEVEGLRSQSPIAF